MNIIIYSCDEWNLPMNNYNQLVFLNETNYNNLNDVDELYGYINSISILINNCAEFIETNINYILDNSHIRFYIYENNIHYFKNKTKDYAKYMLLRNELQNNYHINILSSYWYYYNSLYKINPENLFCFPNFVNNIKYTNINQKPLSKIVLGGAPSNEYPMKKYLNYVHNSNLVKNNLIDNLNGDKYYEYIRNYLCAFSCCLNKKKPYIIKQFFDIPSVGTLLLAYDVHVKIALEEIGFKDNINYISCNRNNILEKIEFICNPNNIEKINEIRTNGFNLVKNNHTINHRLDYLYKIIQN